MPSNLLYTDQKVCSAERFGKLRSELRWDRPQVNGRPLPRSACWLTADGCSCTYRYSGTSWPNMIMPPWFLDITDAVCRACGVTERPNSCNANLYEDETDSVGWHADDEPCFDAKHSDALIISLSLGSTRTFVLRPLDDPKSQTQLSLENGDLATMEGAGITALQTRVFASKHVQLDHVQDTDAWLDATLPAEECACEEAAPGLNWQEFLKDLRDNLDDDPSFSRPWVHRLCSSAYATFFNEFYLEEATYQVSKSTCGAGLLAVAAVCSQLAMRFLKAQDKCVLRGEELVLPGVAQGYSSWLHTQRHDGREFTFQWRRWQSYKLPFTCDAAGRSAVGDAGAVCRTLNRLMIRWVGFWHALLDPKNGNNSEVDTAAWKSAQDWVESGVVTWHYDDICAFLDLARSNEKYGTPRVLNAGSGPLAPGRIDCGQSVPVVASDGLARFYLQLFDILQHEPPAFPLQCPTEALNECFPQHHFDVVHMRSELNIVLFNVIPWNSLDHANDPLMGILQLIWVVRPGGWVLLRHARNEGVAGHFQLGLHQWAFDIEDAPDGQHFDLESISACGRVSVVALRGLRFSSLVQKHYLHAVLSERVERGARINLTWRWVKRHDRECVRRRDRASTVPIKLQRQVSEKKAEFRAAARSAAAVVKNNALQMAAASAESAKLSRAASAGGQAPISRAPVNRAPVSRAPVNRAPVNRAPVSRAPVSRAPVSRAPVRRAPVSKTGSIFRRPRGSKDVRAASPVRGPEEKDRERSSDRNPATVTKAHDAFKRRSDGVRNALDISHSLSDSLSEKIYEKARKLDLGVPEAPLSGKDAAGSSLSLADRPKSGVSSVSTFLDSHARPAPAPRGSSKPRREATMAMAPGREESTRDGAALSPSRDGRGGILGERSPGAMNKLVLKPRDSKRPDAVARPEGAEGQQNRSRKGTPSKEEPRRRDTPGGRGIPVDTEILLAKAEMLMRPLPSQDQEGARAESDRPRPDRSDEVTTARVWKARSSTGPPSAREDDLPEPVHLRGRDSDVSQMSGQQDRARSHRHVVLKSRSRSPKDRGRAAAPMIRRREDLQEDLRARRPVVLESRRSDFPEPSSTRQVITSQDEDDRRGPWEGRRDGTSPRALARTRPDMNGLSKSSAGHRTDAQSDRQAPRHRDRPEDFVSTGDWSSRHVEKDPYPDGRSARRHEDGPTDFRENNYPEERRAPRNALAEHTSDRKDWQRRDGESQSHQPHGRPEEERGSRSHAVTTSERLAPRDDERRYKDRPREEERRTPRAKTSEAPPPPPPPPRDDRHDQEERSYRTGQPHLSSNRWSEAASSTEEFRDRGDCAPTGWLTSRDRRERGEERHHRDGAHDDYRREWDPDPREKETWDPRPSRRESHRFDDFSGPQREIHEERQEQRVWRDQRSAKPWDSGRRPKDGMHTESTRQERHAFDARSSNRSTQWRETTPRTRR
eukprot:s475_g32.t2